MMNNIAEREGDLFNEGVYLGNKRGVVRGNIGEGAAVLEVDGEKIARGTMNLRPTKDGNRRTRSWFFNSPGIEGPLFVAEEGLREG